MAPDNAEQDLPRVQGIQLLLDGRTLRPVVLLELIAEVRVIRRTVLEHRILAGTDRGAHDTVYQPHRVRPSHQPRVVVEGGLLAAQLPPWPWNVRGIATE